MKKRIKWMILLIVIGFIIGNRLYGKYHESVLDVFKNGYTYYFLQEGVYSNYDVMLENTKVFDNKVVEYKNRKYYVYLGINSNYDNALKIKKIYEDKGYVVSIKEIDVDNDAFYNNVVQFDLLIDKTSDDQEVLTIEEVILANYEELVSKNN